LQGASLEYAQLQGASLHSAQLQGAVLVSAGLQGAKLDWAHLQAAVLAGARLQGASLEYAQLQGASLEGAQLQGASLEYAQLQGTWLVGAVVNATDFSDAFLWRTRIDLDPAKLGAVRLDAALERWKPVWQKNSSLVPWDAKAYAELRGSMNSIPEGERRDAALKRIEALDCANPDKTLASCDPRAAPPPEVLVWQKELTAAGVDDTAYAKALPTELQSLVCASDVNAIHILRGILNSGRLAETGLEAPHSSMTS
jgi:Pentapeptide repeats (8 copies)